MINEKNVSPENEELTTVSGEMLRVVGSARILLQVGGIVVWTARLVVDGIQRLICGRMAGEQRCSMVIRRRYVLYLQPQAYAFARDESRSASH